MLVGVLVASGLTGCGEVNKGSAKGVDFERAITARHAAVLEDVTYSADNVLPWSGSFRATVTVRPTATADELAAVERSVAQLLGDGSDTAAVWANGVELCTDGAVGAAHRLLRERLLSASASLAGRLACSAPYAGSLADLSVDVPVVQAAAATGSGLEDLRVRATLTSPRGRVVGLWTELSPHVDQAVGVVGAEDFNSFELDGSALTLRVQPGVDPVALTVRVESVAPEVDVTVVHGSVNGVDTPLPDAATTLRSTLQALPEVDSVRFVTASQVVIRVRTSAAVAPTATAALPVVGAVAPMHVHVTTQISDSPLWTVDSGVDLEAEAGPVPERLADFSALASSTAFTAVGWREPSGGIGRRMVTLTAPAGGDLRTVLPIVKRHVPQGTDLNLHLGDEDYYLDAAPRLEPSDGDVRELPDTFVETWNALP